MFNETLFQDSGLAASQDFRSEFAPDHNDNSTSKGLEVAYIFRQSGGSYQRTHRTTAEESRIIRAIKKCRTSALGGHIDVCDQCGFKAISYYSCRNRHCPKCQALDSARWLDEHKADLLPVEYYHIVFKLPARLAPLVLRYKKFFYNLLFDSASIALRETAANPDYLGAVIGFLAILQTWGQQLQFHPHLHCLIPGGGLSPDGRRWIRCSDNFFLPSDVLSQQFRRQCLRILQRAFDKGDLKLHGKFSQSTPACFLEELASLDSEEWAVYIKPSNSAAQVLDYLARYSHRVAISNDRLVEITETGVSFRCKDYQHQNRQRIMTLSHHEFIRRFLLHTLPPGFQRIRQYGFLSNRSRRVKLALCRKLLNCSDGREQQSGKKKDFRVLYEELTGRSHWHCPRCQCELHRSQVPWSLDLESYSNSQRERERNNTS